jgi:histidine triad (HIT) family protein
MSSACVFCQIAEGKASAQVIHRDERLTAFHDQNPQAPVHVLIVPNRHIENVNALASEDDTLAGAMILLAQQLAGELGIASSGYRLVLNTGLDGGQSIPHLHLHLLGGRRLGWPPG